MQLIAFVYKLIKNIHDTYDVNEIGTDNLKHLHFVTLEAYIYFRKATFSLDQNQPTL